MIYGRATHLHESARTRASFLLLVFFLSSPVLAQRGDVPDPRILENFPIDYRTAPGTALIMLKVFAERGGTHLDRQALLRLVNINDGSELWQTTDNTGQGVFTNVPLGKYELEVSAVGYFAAHQEVHAADSMQPSLVSIVLQRDPSAINLDLGGAIVSPKARKDAKRAVSLLKSGNLAGAQKHLNKAYQLAPSSPDLNFLLGYLYFQTRNFDQAGTYLATAANLDPHNAQALTLLGRTGLERQDYPAARSALEKAVLEDAENWLPHGLLADTYLRQQDYEKARQEAEIALNKGKKRAAPAHLILGQALLGLGRDQEGIQVLNLFLEESPHDEVDEQVRNLIAEVGDHPRNTADGSGNPHIQEVDSLGVVPAPALPDRSWQPPGVDDIQPAVVATPACPATDVVAQSGRQVEELVDEVSRFAAVEDLFHQRLDRSGLPTSTERRKYNYVASISEPQPGLLNVDEYRSGNTEQGSPDQIASSGFATLALVFHPHLRDDFDLSCEGLGDWHGQPTWLVHFRQRENRPNHMHSYNLSGQTYSVGLKGRAWVTADTYQIVRIEADILKPMPEIQLLSEHQMVEYGPVPFPQKNTTLWLPKSAEIYFDFRKHHYYRRHSFDHYMLFAVDTQERRKEPTMKTP